MSMGDCMPLLQMPGQLRRRHGDVRKLLDGRIRHHTAVRHEQHTFFPESAVFDFHDLTARSGLGVRGHLDHLE